MKLLAAGLAFCLPVIALAADTVDTNVPFKVATGPVKGSCDKRGLSHVFQEVTDIADSAFNAINDIIGKQSTGHSSSKMMFMMFGLNGKAGQDHQKVHLKPPKCVLSLSSAFLGDTIYPD